VNIPQDLVYTKEHEWIQVDENILTIGITDFAQGELGDIIFVEIDITTMNSELALIALEIQGIAFTNGPVQ
jgi:glycine cleavage system H protein